MKNQPWLILCIIALIAGLALSVTNNGHCRSNRRAARQGSPGSACRRISGPQTASTRCRLKADSVFDSTLEAKAEGVTIGYVIQITVAGYGGPIEIIMGVDIQGTITGESVTVAVNMREQRALGKRRLYAFRHLAGSISLVIGRNANAQLET